LPVEQRQLLGLAARLHDVGKLCLPRAVLDKPGALTAEEYRRVQRHAVLGECLLARLLPRSDFLRIVRHHHERYDGHGYPDGLSGADIPLLARVLAIADSFDVMTDGRPYRVSRPCAEAFEQLGQQAGQQFDPVLVNIFRRVCPGPAGGER